MRGWGRWLAATLILLTGCVGPRAWEQYAQHQHEKRMQQREYGYRLIEKSTPQAKPLNFDWRRK